MALRVLALLPTSVAMGAAPVDALSSASRGIPGWQGLAEAPTVRVQARRLSPLNPLGLDDRERPASVHRVSADLIASRSKDDWMSVLDRVPGFFPVSTFGTMSTATVRGLSRFGLLVVEDGVRDDSSLYATRGAPSPLQALGSIEVLKGPAALEAGQGAVAGVLQLLPRQPSATPGFDLALGQGLTGSQRLRLGGQGTAGLAGWAGRWDVSVAQHRDPRGADGGHVAFSGSLGSDGRTDAWWKLSYGAHRSRQATDAGLPTDPVSRWLRPDSPLNARYNTPQDRLESEAQRANLALGVRGEDWHAENRLGWSRSRHDYLSAERLRLTNTATRLVDRSLFYQDSRFESVFNRTQLGLRTRRLGSQDWVLAYELRGYRQTGTGYGFGSSLPKPPPIDLFAPQESAAPVAIAPNRRAELRHWVHSGDLSSSLRFGDAYLATGGFRVEAWQGEDALERLEPATGASVESFPLTRSARLLPSWRWGLSAPLRGLGTAYAAGSSTPFALLVSDADDGRTDFDPETTEQVEAGWRWDRNRWKASAALFAVTQSNLLISFGAGAYSQAGLLRSSGAELAFTAPLGLGAELEGGYSYIDAHYVRFVDNGTDRSGRRRPRTPYNMGFLDLTFRPHPGWQVKLGGRAVGDTYISEDYLVLLPAYWVADLNVQRRWHDWVLRVRVENLADQRDYFVSGIGGSQVYPGAPRNIFASMEWTYGSGH